MAIIGVYMNSWGGPLSKNSASFSGGQILEPEQTFRALIREATFTKEMLCSGATQIRKANYAAHGVYAQAFTALSVGLERIGKLCLILDHYIESDGCFPDFIQLKKKIGHKLQLLQEQGSEIAVRRVIRFKFLSALDHPLHASIIRVLHGYADGDRYSNINLLVGAKQQDDPIAGWFNLVDRYIWTNIVRERQKKKIARNAAISHQLMSMSIVLHTAETGELIESYEDASFRSGMLNAVSPYRQLYVLQIIRYWVELLWELGCQAQTLGRGEIPFFGEIFAGFYNDDSYFKSRKTWEF